MKKILFALIALLGIVACETEPKPVEVKQTLTLAADNSEIFADGAQMVTFTVKDEAGAVVEDATIYFAETNEALAGNSFKTKFAGEYTFYAQKGNNKSNEITIVAKEVTDETKVVTLGVEPTTIKADGVETATFAVMCNNEAVDATIYNAADDSALEGNTFTTTVAGEYTFYAMYEDVRSNNVTVTAEAVVAPEPDTLVLSVDKSVISADGVDTATFITKVNGESVEATIYSAANDAAMNGKTFSTVEVGEYKFYAKYNELVSNEVTITANTVEPITLSASKDTLVANGVDNIVFTVKQGGSNVTSKSTIYVDGTAINGNKFYATTPGTYTVYAKMGTQTSNEITITAEEAQTGKTIVFADGVTLTSGWYDVNKFMAGDNGDINMCWAAAASNIIQWFQDRYVAAGNTLPAIAVNGPATEPAGNHLYELALMNIYWNEWDNGRGGHVDQAVSWYFEGKLNSGETAAAGSQATPKTKGGYWSSVWQDVAPYVYCGYEETVGFTTYSNLYSTSFNSYNIWGKGSGLSGNESLLKFSEYVIASIDRGIASLTVSLNSSSGLLHAVTLWGYEVDNATGCVTRLWITDSDDLMTEPKSELLNEYSVSVVDGALFNIKLSGNTRYGAIYATEIKPVSGYGSAGK